MKNLKKLNKTELIKYIENSKINTQQNKIRFVEFLLRLKSWLIKFTIVVLLIKWFKRYSWYRKIWSVLSFISVSLFGVTLLDIYGFTFLGTIFSWLQGTYLYGVFSSYVFKFENPLKRADMPSKESLRETNKNSKRAQENPRISEWFAERNKIIQEKESNNNIYYIILVILMFGLGWYYWDSINQIPFNVWYYFRKRRPKGPDSGGEWTPGANIDPNSSFALNNRSNQINSGDTINIKVSDFKKSVKNKFYPTESLTFEEIPLESDNNGTYNPFKFLYRTVKTKLENYKELRSSISSCMQFDKVVREETMKDYCNRSKTLKFEQIKNLREDQQIELINNDLILNKTSDLELFNLDMIAEENKMKHFLYIMGTTGFPLLRLRDAIHDVIKAKLENLQQQNPEGFNTWLNTGKNIELLERFSNYLEVAELEAGPSNSQDQETIHYEQKSDKKVHYDDVLESSRKEQDEWSESSTSSDKDVMSPEAKESLLTLAVDNDQIKNSLEIDDDEINDYFKALSPNLENKEIESTANKELETTPKLTSKEIEKDDTKETIKFVEQSPREKLMDAIRSKRRSHYDEDDEPKQKSFNSYLQTSESLSENEKEIVNTVIRNENENFKSDSLLNWADCLSTIDKENQTVKLNLSNVIKDTTAIRIITTNNDSIGFEVGRENLELKAKVKDYLNPTLPWGSKIDDSVYKNKSEIYSIDILDNQLNFHKVYVKSDHKW